VNANTASAEVIAAAAGIDLSDAQRLVQARSGTYFRNTQDIQAQLGGDVEGVDELGVGSDFFEVRARLRLDKLVVEERSVLRRIGDKVLVITRERGPGRTNGPASSAMAQR
jgi:general secretion pathway protein K